MIELIVLDVDGTLTNGQIIYTSNGDELKPFDVKDGMGVACWTKKLDKKAAIITGRESELVKRRAEDLGVTHLYQKIHNKDEILEQILEQEGLTWDNVAAIGDDLNDYKMLKKAKLSFCPADAVEDIKSEVDVVCTKIGGSGAVREMVEHILKYNNSETSLKDLWV